MLHLTANAGITLEMQHFGPRSVASHINQSADRRACARRAAFGNPSLWTIVLVERGFKSALGLKPRAKALAALADGVRIISERGSTGA